ncbi:Structural maintenance of chromosomes protein 3 [Dispira simplex]|nr:Structural maintenance of chromosomes protein 3 [Dispira simplex]
MHIKQIIIQGFKSYKDQTVIEPFSPRHNAVVGRNGSGKSNFFAALRFVLSDAYTNMNREERQALLHEGSGPTTMSAFVEVIFDNSDNRFPTGKSETVIRRTIGLKKDEYSLDRRTATKTDIMNLLESAGFSRSNPYYIVPQGRVTSLTHAKDPERLQLLKEVAGTRVYETRRQESVKILDDTRLKREKIDELLAYIEERLSELEEEKDELRQFQELDRDRRCLEYTIYSREQNDIVDMLEELEEDRRRDMVGSNQQREDLADQERVIADMEKEIMDLRQKREFLSVERQRFSEEYEEQIKVKAQLELSVQDYERDQQQNQQNKDKLEQDIGQIRRQIEERETELKEFQPTYQSTLENEQRLRAQYDGVTTERQSVLARQGRSSQFRNRRQRDQWLQKEMESVQRTVDTQAQHVQELTDEIGALRRQMEKAERAIETDQAQMAGLAKENQNLVNRTRTLREERDRLTDQRKNLWREDALADSKMGVLQDELRKAERALGGMMSKSTHQGLQFVSQLVKDGKISGVYGPLYELFEVDHRYKTAVETIGGTSLFNVVVDNDATATRVLDQLRKAKAGRVTMMPLNRLRPRPVDYPTASDAIPIVHKLKYAPRFNAAMKQVFGKAIICPTLEVASAYARSHHVTGITLEGDRVDKKGSLTGGFMDTRRSRLDAVHQLRQRQTQWDELTASSKRIKQEIAELDAQVTQVLSDLQLVDAERRHSTDRRKWSQMDVENKERELKSYQESLVHKEKALVTAEAQVKQWQAQVETFATELQSPFTSGLSAEEQAHLDQLGTQADALSKQLDQITGERVELESRKNVLENELQANLYRRLQGLERRLEQTHSDQSTEELHQRQHKLQHLEQTLEELAQQVQDTEAQLEDHMGTIDDLQQNLETARADQVERLRQLESLQKNAEKYLSKRSLLLQRKEECTRHIRELGVLPEEAFTRYVDVQTQKVIRKLHKVNEGLKKYGHVNKKAFEQYHNFTKQRDDLLKRREELDTSFRSIEDLIQVLDLRKDEAIERTFKQVAKYFAEVFEKLVPTGKGQLIMQRRVDRDNVDDEPSLTGDNGGGGEVENYMGVAIKVSFNSKTDEGLRMQQLSGGQKSVVALGLIFAIQRCDPAPFYLFDEIDANLDAVYRTSVARMIHELSENAQFITTTFRPELLADCDKFYGVTFVNKVSHVNCISKQDALGFVEQEHI